MKYQPIPLPIRCVLFAALALLLAGEGLGPSPTMASDQPFPEVTALVAVPIRPGSVFPESTLPFSIQDFAAFLGETFHMLPIESEPDCIKFIYAERQGDGRDLEIMRIMLRSREAHLQVAFSFKEFNVMHYVAEFMEGPFFTRAESEQLYELLYAPPVGQPSWKQVGRFRAKVTLVDGSDGMDALFEFAAAASVGGR
jgi:hypothetical protein